jgi:hypothetical protein
MNYHESLEKSVIMKEREYKAIKKEVEKYLKQTKYTPETKMTVINNYLEKNHTLYFTNCVQLVCEVEGNKVTLTKDSMHTTKPLAEILCEDIKDERKERT